ncbi:Vegetative incompatibility protein HET-E-1 [Colletotrichum siamense]|nr:Vegetative incompatibility protein HET-E-1 [Colletotrichum siamense]
MSSQYAGRKRRQSSADSGTLDKSTTRMKTNLSSSTTGAQHNNSGTGKQYNNSDSGTQYNAEKIEIVNKEKDNFLADLRVTDPRDDKVRIQRTKGDLLVDSYRWIIDHDDFHQWRAKRRLLWIKGAPGKGKTMLLCGMIDELVAMGYTSTFFFFCQATDARLNNATSVLRGLLYLMLDRNPSLLNLIRDKYDRAGADIFEDVNSWDVLCKMILSVISHESLGDVVLIIDALDECVSGLDQLISFIIDLTAHAKVIASSRPELRIDRGLAAALEDTKVYLSLELNEDVISAAVNSYICHKVERLAVLKGFDEGTKTYVRDYLAAKANSTFLWVALVYEHGSFKSSLRD